MNAYHHNSEQITIPTTSEQRLKISQDHRSVHNKYIEIIYGLECIVDTKPGLQNICTQQRQPTYSTTPTVAQHSMSNHPADVSTILPHQNQHGPLYWQCIQVTNGKESHG